MITPSYSATATERVLPRMALDFTTGTLDPRVTVTRALNTATRVNASGFIEIVNANLPRFDYNPATLTPRGLLIEESRTNALTYSNDFNNVIWTKTNCSIVLAGTSPDGTANTNVLVENSASGNHWFFTANAVVGSYTLSVYAKPDTRNWLVMRVTLATGNAIAFFNVSTGVVGTLAAGLTATITPAGNGFYRCSISGTLVVGAVVIGAASADGVASYAGNSGNALGIYGAQLEAGAFATSYIPTTTLATLRNADAVSMTGTNFSDWYNASAGTLAVSATGYNAATVAQGGVAPTAVSLYAIAATSPYASIAIVRRDAATLNSPTGYILSDTGTIGADIQKNTISWVGATVNAAIAWNGSTNAAFTANGLTVGTDTSYTLPTSDSLQIGRWGSESISGYWSGHIRKVSFYPQRLTNAELQAITT
jgi:hypothetical protein